MDDSVVVGCGKMVAFVMVIDVCRWIRWIRTDDGWDGIYARAAEIDF